MKDFSSGEYWEKRYLKGRTSGVGSYGKLSEFKAEIINQFIEDNNIQSVIEFGCGDGHQLSLLKIPKYIGLDVSKTSIQLCIDRFKNDNLKSFSLYYPNSFYGNLAELALSLDVIYHLIEDEVFEKYMFDLFSSSNKFVIIYSSNADMNKKGQVLHIKHRFFSKWIDNNLSKWKLIKKIKNRYPKNSNADFYMYRRLP